MTRIMNVNGKFTDIYSYVKNILFLMVLLTVGATSAWAQGLSGVYYIGSVNYNAAKTTTNYYLCPTEGWAFYEADNSVTGDDNGKPFLTTYQCRNGENGYDASKAVWVIVKATAPNEEYYYIKQKSTGRYLVSNGKIAGTTNANRMRVHLETIAQESLDDKELFSIEPNSTWLVISPKSSDGWNGNYKWYTVNGGNQNFLVGKGKDGGPSGYTETGGILGTYTKDDANAKFYLEDYIQKPSIFYNTSNQIQITVQADATIIYTTDGTDPTNDNGTKVNANTTSFTFNDASHPIKAVAVVEGFLSKEIAVFTPPVLLGNTNKYLIQSQNNGWTIDESTTDFHFYMVPGDKDNNNYLRVTTTSLFRPSMEWYFKGAGMENGAQFYYIVNNATGNYLCYENNVVYMATGSTDDKFKFKISASSGDASSFNITPYAQRNVTNNNRFINRTGTNGFYGNDTNSRNPLNLDKNDSPNTRWKFVLPSTLDTEAPFTVSDNTKASYYKIGNVGASGYFIIPPTGTATNATVSNSDDPYFEEVSAPSKSPVETGYYHIRNAITGDYLYFTKNKNNDGACLATNSTITAGDEERYQFIWAKTADANVNYYIIPKLLKDASLNQFSSLRKHDTNTNILTNVTRGAGNFAWTFVDTHFCFDPIITQAVDGTRTVTITCPTPGVDIYYTTDGSEPTFPVGETTTQKYEYDEEHPFIPDVAVDQIKVIAVRQNDNTAQSAVVSFTLPKYTYYIVNRSNELAVSKADVRQAAGTTLSGYASIPTEIQSSYISDETITFYTMTGDFNAANLDGEHSITKTPATSANIYITYTTTKLGSKFLSLTNSAPFNIKDTGKCQYVENDELKTDGATAEYKSDRQYLWYFLGADPYKVTVQNVSTSKWLTYSDPTLSVGESSQTYILKGTANHANQTNTKYEDVTLVDASGNTFTIGVNTVVLPIRFTLIDKQNNVIQSGIEYDGSLSLPAAWRSPLATYHYWNANAFVQTNGTPNVPYVFVDEDKNGTPDASEITSVTQVASDNIIYVTYDVDNSLLDLDGRNSLKIKDKVNLTYRLQFSGGTNFYQEDGKDDVMTETRKPVYPYSNGDAALYVYGNERWEEQLASGATTRTRWLWYIEPGRKLTKDNTLADLDPYHVKISSYQTQTNYKIDDDNTRNFHSYLKTYAVSYGDPAVTHIVTGVTNDNPLVTGKAKDQEADNSDATQYMLLGPSLSQLKLVTVEAISDGTTTERRTVNSFEQYWKNNPTVQDKLTTKVTEVGRNVTLTSTQKTELQSVKVKDDVTVAWHVYKTWTNSQPWVHNNDASGGEAPTTTKKFLNEEHVFQTIQMGDGTFQFVPTDIKPMLILLDQHGWEIVRLPLPSGPTDPKRPAMYADIHKYSSPMVERYHYWKTGTKVPGYHQYTVKDYATDKDDSSKEYTTAELGVFDASTNTGNLPDYESQALVNDKERDWYVTYDVKSEYTSTYSGAATKGATSAAPYLIKQNGRYAQISGTSLTSTDTEPDIKNVPKSMQWYLRPNFDIDEEMGYIYKGNPGAQEEADTKANTEAAYFAAGQNGFDPYNVQIQSVDNENRYFTANTDKSAVTSYWAGTSSAISLQNLDVQQDDVIGLDQVDMKITNATFMVVTDRNGNMRLMPRFDNTKVMQSFTTLASPAKEGTDSIAQTLTLTMVPKVVNSSSEINAMGGYYMLGDNFTASGSIGTSTAPFKGTIEGQLDKTFDVSAPLVAYAEDATIKNIIIGSASITSGNDDAHAGAIVATALGDTRVYNCGVNGGSVSGDAHVGSIIRVSSTAIAMPILRAARTRAVSWDTIHLNRQLVT